MRAVFDTVIFVRALINPQSLCGRLIFDYRRAYDLVVSPQLTAEYREVLGRLGLSESIGRRKLAT
jgi:predicted nucleic acid-binding protein